MPQAGSKHQQEQPITISDLSGGINVAAHPTQIADNECVWVENMFIEPVSGRMRTRYPFMASFYDSTFAGIPMDALYYWKDFLFIAANQNLYYLKVSTATEREYAGGVHTYTSLGRLNGSVRPTFAPFHDKLMVASGGVLQNTYLSSGVPAALADVSNAPSLSYIIEKTGRVVGTGDPNYPDRVWQCYFFDETDWTSGTDDDYADIGFQDGMATIGITEFAEMYMVFKRGDGCNRTYYMSELADTTGESYPNDRKLSDIHCPVSHEGVIGVGDKVYMMESFGITSIVGTDKQGKLVVDLSPGIKMGSKIQCNTGAFAVVYPKDFQVWFFPSFTNNRIYVYHYLRNAWTTFRASNLVSDFSFVSPEAGAKGSSNYPAVIKIWDFTSAVYVPVNQRMYLGTSQGAIVSYKNRTTMHDTGTVDIGKYGYPQTVITKAYDFGGRREFVVKAPVVNHIPIGKPYLYSTYQMKVFVNTASGTSTAYSSDYISGVSHYTIGSDTSKATKIYNGIGVKIGNPTGVIVSKLDYNFPIETNVQFEVVMFAGGTVLDSISMDTAMAQKKGVS